MKRKQSMQTKIERSLGRLHRFIPKPESRLTNEFMISIESEIVPIIIDFSIRGAWTDERGGAIIVHVTIENWTPKDIDLDPGLLHELVQATIEIELDWMREIPWKLSIDKDSLRNLQRVEKKKKYWMHITKPIKRQELRTEEVVEVLSDLLVELRPEFKDVLVSQGVIKDDNGLVRIETKGLPCPLCLGHLSDHVITSMFHRLRFEGMFDDDDDGDDEVNSR